ncbi:MAG: double-strand break repair protein AddB [Rhodospirillales bacterium]|nr:double-strand break repair protein AddB [Rhodospirillales bacterium]
MKLEASPEASLYTIPAGVPFVDSLAAGILELIGEAPEKLIDVTVLLPTRRAQRGLRDAFLRQGGGRPMLLPRMMALGDLDVDELAITGADELGLDGGDQIGPAISNLHRLILLGQLVEKFEGPDVSPDQALRLAGELARLLDQVQTERLSFEDLAGLVRGDLAEHWQQTLDFLKILSEQWPPILEAEGCIDPARRRGLMLAAQMDLWRHSPPDGWVIAAGSTGTIPATAELLALVARLERGVVVLPGLDLELAPQDMEALGPTHPQFGMIALLGAMELTPGEVKVWETPEVQASPPARARLINQALSPAGRTDGWPDLPAPPSEALENVMRIDCPGPEEEAGVIALLMRRALEEEQSAALVTPDRALARRVAGELRRWEIEVDDSAGRPLSHEPPGAFLRLVAEMAAGKFAPLALLSCLKHPLAAGGMAPGVFRAKVRDLEMEALRGPRPAPGLAGIILALGEDKKSLTPWLEELLVLARPLSGILSGPAAPLGEILTAHMAFCQALCTTDTQSGAERLWAGDAGEAAAAFIDELADASGDAPPLEGRNYGAVFDVLMSGHAVRPHFGLHPRLSIWGLLEARLQQADLMILGGLNEGSWPPDARADPWMSRPMRTEFGLPLPERRIGLAAHDFAQAFSAPHLAMTRAVRAEGSPSVPSRWLSRLEKLLHRPGGEIEQSWMSTPWTNWQAQLDAPEEYVEMPRPAPRPPLAARPRRLSVTEIETWMRDPYGIYARRILDLRALEPLDAAPDAANYGTIIHRALEKFLKAYPAELPEDAETQLMRIGEEEFGQAMSHPGVWAFWWPRFQRIVSWFVDAEREGREGLNSILTEVNGLLLLEAPAGHFELRTKADRMDSLEGGGLRIVDYKTGAIPSKTEVAGGYAPQLPLEAAIALAGGFKGLAAGEVDALHYWRLSGGDPAGEISAAGDDPMGLAEEARAGLVELIAEFDQVETAYESRPRPDKAPRYSDYEHLARVKEWSAGGHGDGSEGE